MEQVAVRAANGVAMSTINAAYGIADSQGRVRGRFIGGDLVERRPVHDYRYGASRPGLRPIAVDAANPSASVGAPSLRATAR